MDIENILNDYKSGSIKIADAKKKLSMSWVETATNEIIDINRQARIGIPEIVYAEYKTLQQTIDISAETLKNKPTVIISRSSFNKEIEEHFKFQTSVYNGTRVIVLGKIPEPAFNILLISGGSSDKPVIEEAALTLKALGANALVYEDRGIAHPSRVLQCIKEGIEKEAKACIVVAGMEASLATYAGSLLPMPVIGVPTSIGYGYRNGESALLSMLSSCTPNLAVVNIDGGIRAAIIAYMIGVKK